MLLGTVYPYLSEDAKIVIYDSHKLDNGGQKILGEYRNKTEIPESMKECDITLLDVGLDYDIWIDIQVPEMPE